MKVDFGRTAADYARHRAGFPDRFYDRLAAHGIVPASAAEGPEIRALDLGTGTGTLARGLALRGWRVVGLDHSAAMLAAARDLDAAAGVRIGYVQAPAEATGLADDTFALVMAGSCWHWFDRPRTAREARRLLVPGGWLVIAALDWDPRPGSVVAATERLIARHNPAWRAGGGFGFRHGWRRDLVEAGFTDIAFFTFGIAVPYSHAGWRGRIRASAGVAASLDEAAVAHFDAEHGRLLAACFPGDPFEVPHRVSALLARAPAR